jgi:hypothetical protein
VAGTAVQRPVPPVLVHRGTAPLGVRGERVVGIDARESARRLVRRSGTAVLAHALDGLRPRSWSPSCERAALIAISTMVQIVSQCESCGQLVNVLVAKTR